MSILHFRRKIFMKWENPGAGLAGGHYGASHVSGLHSNRCEWTWTTPSAVPSLL